MRAFLEERGVKVPNRPGWVKVSCFNKDAHPRGDRNPSASVNPTKGQYRCFACDAGGDVFDLLMMETSCSYPEAKRILGDDGPPKVEPTWI